MVNISISHVENYSPQTLTHSIVGVPLYLGYQTEAILVSVVPITSINTEVDKLKYRERDVWCTLWSVKGDTAAGRQTSHITSHRDHSSPDNLVNSCAAQCLCSDRSCLKSEHIQVLVVPNSQE